MKWVHAATKTGRWCIWSVRCLESFDQRTRPKNITQTLHFVGPGMARSKLHHCLKPLKDVFLLVERSGRKWLQSMQIPIPYSIEMLCHLGECSWPYVTKGCQQGTQIVLLTFRRPNGFIDILRKGLMQLLLMAKRKLILLLIMILWKNKAMLMHQVMNWVEKK